MKQAANPITKLVRAEDIADMLDVQTSTVYEWARVDYIPHVRIGTGKQKPCLRFDIAEVQQWLSLRRTEGRTSRVPHVCP